MSSFAANILYNTVLCLRMTQSKETTAGCPASLTFSASKLQVIHWHIFYCISLSAIAYFSFVCLFLIITLTSMGLHPIVRSNGNSDQETQWGKNYQRPGGDKSYKSSSSSSFPKLLSLESFLDIPDIEERFLVRGKQYQSDWNMTQETIIPVPSLECHLLSMSRQSKPSLILHMPFTCHLFQQVIPVFGFQFPQVWH